MAYVCLGFSHYSAPLELREKLKIESRLLSRSFSNFVLLSTSDRFEIYAATNSVVATDRNGDTAYELLRAISRNSKTDINYINRFAELYFDIEAAEHLFRVATGLKSSPQLESNILDDLAQALIEAEQLSTADTELRSLFRSAIIVGNRAAMVSRTKPEMRTAEDYQRFELSQINSIILEELSLLNSQMETSREDNITQLRRQLEEIRRSELTKIQSVDSLDNRVGDLLDRFSVALVEKIIQESQSMFDRKSHLPRYQSLNRYEFLDLDPPNSIGELGTDSNFLD